MVPLSYTKLPKTATTAYRQPYKRSHAVVTAYENTHFMGLFNIILCILLVLGMRN